MEEASEKDFVPDFQVEVEVLSLDFDDVENSSFTLDDFSFRDRDFDVEEVESFLDGLGDDILGCLDDVSSRDRVLDEEEVVTVLNGLGDDDLSRDEDTDFDDLNEVSFRDRNFDDVDEEP